MKIRDISKMAHDMAKSAYDTGKKAREQQEEMFTKLNDMTVSAAEAIELAVAVSKKVMNAKNATENTLKEAKVVLDEALKPIADTGIAAIRGLTSISLSFKITLNILCFHSIVGKNDFLKNFKICFKIFF